MDCAETASSVAGAMECAETATSVAGAMDRAETATSVAGAMDCAETATPVAGAMDCVETATPVAGAMDCAETATSVAGAMDCVKTATSVAGAMDCVETATPVAGAMDCAETATSVAGAMDCVKTATSVAGAMDCAETATSVAGAMENDLYFDSPQGAMAQVVTDVGLTGPLESILNDRRKVVASLLTGTLPNWIIRTTNARFAAIQFHPPHSGDQVQLAHFHVREVTRVDGTTPASNEGTRIQVRGFGELWIRQSGTRPGCRDHYFINKPSKDSNDDSKAFEKFTEILRGLLEKCRNKEPTANYPKPALSAQVVTDVIEGWKHALEPELPPDHSTEGNQLPPDYSIEGNQHPPGHPIEANHMEPVNWAVKSVIPSAVALEVGSRVALEVGKKVGVKVVGKGIGQGVGKAVGGIGSVGGLVTDVALDSIPGASEAVGESGRIGIGFAASAGVGAMFAGPVGAAVGVVGYGIGEGVSQLIKWF